MFCYFCFALNGNYSTHSPCDYLFILMLVEGSGKLASAVKSISHLLSVHNTKRGGLCII